MNIDSSKCERKVRDLYGAAGIAWLEHLPELVEEYVQRWSLAVLPPFDYDSYGYVCPAIRDGQANVVLKLCLPNPELTRQAEILRIANGDGMVRLLEAEPERGALLLERALPGTMLSELPSDEQITEIAAGVMARLWKPAPVNHPFPTVAEWAADLDKIHARFAGGYGPFPPRLVEQAKGLFQELLAAGEADWLIHGDANPYNILRAEREPWLVIDPKGIVGPRLYDAATFLNNLPEDRPLSEVRPILARRIDQMAEILGFPRDEVKAWGQAHAVLAGYWTFEDHGDGWQVAFSFAGLYDEI